MEKEQKQVSLLYLRYYFHRELFFSGGMQLQSMKGEEKVSHVVSEGELLFPLIFASPDEAITVAM